MEKYVLLDRDGTINVEKNYLYRIEDFEYEVGVLEALKEIQKKGYKLAIITNQSGIARGYYTEEDFLKLTEFIYDDLKKYGIIIEKTYYCPHHPEGNMIYGIDCNCRKPGTLLFEKAIDELNIDVKNSYMVGDKISDLIPAAKMGLIPVMVKTGYGDISEKKLEKLNFYPETYKNLLDFSKKIR